MTAKQEKKEVVKVTMETWVQTLRMVKQLKGGDEWGKFQINSGLWNALLVSFVKEQVARQKELQKA